MFDTSNPFKHYYPDNLRLQWIDTDMYNQSTLHWYDPQAKKWMVQEDPQFSDHNRRALDANLIAHVALQYHTRTNHMAACGYIDKDETYPARNLLYTAANALAGIGHAIADMGEGMQPYTAELITECCSNISQALEALNYTSHPRTDAFTLKLFLQLQQLSKDASIRYAPKTVS